MPRDRGQPDSCYRSSARVGLDAESATLDHPHVASLPAKAARRLGLAGIAVVIDSPDGGSVLVFGDGSGMQDDE